MTDTLHDFLKFEFVCAMIGIINGFVLSMLFDADERWSLGIGIIGMILIGAIVWEIQQL
jgi:hypothetical protein